MTETDVRYAFERATEEISAPPDLLDRVRAGGRRRVVRRRTVLAAGLAAAAGGAALPLALRGRGGDRVLPATRGDLAGDRRFLGRVRAAWLDALGEPGDVHIWWAGSTPAGPVALVAQPNESLTVHTPDGRDGGPADVLGFVVPAGGRLLVPEQQVVVPHGAVEPIALLAGEASDVLVVAGANRRLSYSADYAFDAAGRITRRFQPLPTGPDGVLVRTVPAQGEHIEIGVRRDVTDEAVTLVDAAERWKHPMAQSQLPRQLDRRLAGSILAWDRATEEELQRWDVTTWPGYTDNAGYHVWTGPTAWWIRGQAPDGRRLVVQTVVLDGRARLFVLLGEIGGEPTPHYLGLLDPRLSTEVADVVDGPLVILHARLPERQGVVVAARNAAFRYRVRGGGPWLPVSEDAALLPEAATELEVRPYRGRTVTLSLPRA